VLIEPDSSVLGLAPPSESHRFDLPANGDIPHGRLRGRVRDLGNSVRFWRFDRGDIRSNGLLAYEVNAVDTTRNLPSSSTKTSHEKYH
jgi:hypothetical protein